MKNINIILPYKETYSSKIAGAVSILVSQLSKLSSYKKKIKVFGSVSLINPITKNYHGIFKKKPFFFFSRTNYYLHLLNKRITNSTNTINEIHNRPQVAKFFLKKKPHCKNILYFHNNPKELRGSKSASERLFLLYNLEKIIFVSEWCRRIFFEDLKIKNSYKAHVVYPGSDCLKKIPKKENLIIFAGKLNYAKGYYIFLEAILKILNKHRNWKAKIIGDDPRSYHKKTHKNLEYTGWISHKKTLNLFSKASIVTIPSLWEEPLGRTSIEASSRGCATILSKSGGLIETNNNGIFLNKSSKKDLFKKIDQLIINKKMRLKLMKNNLSNFKHTIKKTIYDTDKIYNSLY
jgi:glycosyltransferase involved in cell wall biosynthesis